MALNKEQEDLYRKTMEQAKAQLETIDDEMEKEIQRARERLAKLQDSKRSFRQLYEGAARLLDVKIESDDQEKGVKQVTADEDPGHMAGVAQAEAVKNPDPAGIVKKPDNASPQQG